jgi:hypothetical protein
VVVVVVSKFSVGGLWIQICGRAGSLKNRVVNYP